MHNPHDADSRAFVEQHGADDDVLDVFDWYDPEDRRRWVEDCGGTEAVAAFPAIVFDDVEYVEVIPCPQPLAAGQQTRPAGGLRPTIVDVPFTRARQQGVVNWQPEIAEQLRGKGVAVAALHRFRAHREKANADALGAVTWVEAVAEVVPEAVEAEKAKAVPFVEAAEFIGAERAEQARKRLDAK